MMGFLPCAQIVILTQVRVLLSTSKLLLSHSAFCFMMVVHSTTRQPAPSVSQAVIGGE